MIVGIKMFIRQCMYNRNLPGIKGLANEFITVAD